MFKRATSMADAFITAAAREINTGKVDHQTGKGNWVTRRVALNATERGQFGMTTEYDHWPKRDKPVVQATAKPEVPKAYLVHEEDLADVPY